MKLIELVLRGLIVREKKAEIEAAIGGDVIDLPEIRGLRIFGTRSYLTLALAIETPKPRRS